MPCAPANWRWWPPWRARRNETVNWLERLRQLPQGLRLVLACAFCLTVAGALIGLYQLLNT